MAEPTYRSRIRPGSKMADCHPDRRHRGRGLCSSCLATDNIGRRVENPQRMAECHPGRLYKADGLCASCLGNRWKSAHPEIKAAEQARHRVLYPDQERRNRYRAKYGITVEQYEELLEA